MLVELSPPIPYPMMGEVALESNALELDTQVQVEEESARVELDYEDDFNVQYDFVPIIQHEESTKEPSLIPFDMEKPIVPSEFKVGTREYSQFILEESGDGDKYFDPYCMYFMTSPLVLNFFEHMPFHANWAHMFDKLKRSLKVILRIFNLSWCYLCFMRCVHRDLTGC